MFFDWTYVYFVLPAFIFALWASVNVNGTFKKYSKQFSSKGVSASEAARRILDNKGLSDIRIERISGNLTDHYDPKAGVIRLSDSVYDSTSTAAIGVACHEVGHAIQYSENYVPIKIRNAIIPVTNIGSRLSIPLVLLGLFLSYLSEYMLVFAYVGILCFALSTVFQLVTLPTEYNASGRALRAIDEYGILERDEMKGAKKVLSAAAMTYVAALAVSVMQLLRLLSIVNSRRR
ncbi:MAG: zinc metallopeptidase [Clostridiales bacterium]|nr:zinc metallopeptidase [Clostridiales bacterium]